MSSVERFMLVDDDPINNMICKVTIGGKFKKASIIAFERPVEALNYIKANYSPGQNNKTTLFLDINMPVLTGWDFMWELKMMGEEIIGQFDIYLLTSSVDDRDIEKAKSNPNIIRFLSKPLKAETLIDFPL